MPSFNPNPWHYRALGIKPQTLAEKRAAENAVNLFFGALIGANLGSSGDLPVQDYTLLIATLCLFVLYLKTPAVSGQRLRYLARLGAHTALLAVVLFDPLDLIRPERTFPGAAHLFITVCLWLASAAAVALRPLDNAERPS